MHLFTSVAILAAILELTSSYYTRDYTRDYNTRQFQSSLSYTNFRIQYGYSYGLLQAYHNGRWGYVCTDGFTDREAGVVCRAMGFPGSYGYGSNGRAYGSAILNNVHCSSYYYLSQCSGIWTSSCPYRLNIQCYESSSTTQYTSAMTEESTSTVGHLPLRLSTNGMNQYVSYGFLNMFWRGRWVKFCREGFTFNQGHKACRSLGFGGLLSIYNRYDSDIEIKNVNCPWWDDDFTACSFTPGSCSNYRAVYLECQASSTYWQIDTTTFETSTDSVNGSNTLIRLAGNFSNYNAHSGRVEVYHDGQWGTICDDSFDYMDAFVVCRMLGFLKAAGHFTSGHGNGPIWLDDLSCHGDESDISQCGSNGWGVHNCGHSEDIGVNCYDFVGIKLAGGDNYTEGRVEIYHDNEWGTICDDGFDQYNAGVICRMLGFSMGGTFFSNAHYGPGSGRIWMDDVNCKGYESNITECRFNGWGRHDCSHSEDVGVRCYGANTMEPYMTTEGVSPYQTSTSSCYCYNGGTCYSSYPGDVRCSCPYQYYGSRCQYYGVLSSTSSCYCYNGHCLRHSFYPYDEYCECYSGYYGNNCEYYADTTTYYNSCYYNSPCQNGATCYSISYYPHYRCSCPHGYTGQKCESPTGFLVDHYLKIYCNDNGWDISLYLPPLYQEYQDFNPSDIYLGTDSCTGYVSGNYLYFRHDYTQCQTTEVSSPADIVYTGELTYGVHDPQYHFITREYRFRAKVHCHMPRNEGSSGHFNHDSSHNNQPHDVNGTGHHSVNLQFYTDAGFTHLKPSFGSQVGDNVYVKAYTDIRNYNIKMRLDDCYTKPSIFASDSYKFYIIRNGCILDRNAHFIAQDTHETRFVFQDFEYAGNHDSLYIFCNATFCETNDYSAACEQRCRHRRNLDQEQQEKVNTKDDENSIGKGPLERVEVVKLIRSTEHHMIRRSVGQVEVMSNTPEKVTDSFRVFTIVVMACSLIVVVVALTIVVRKVRDRKNKIPNSSRQDRLMVY